MAYKWQKSISHSPEAWRAGIQVPVWSYSGDDTLLACGLQTPHCLLVFVLIRSVVLDSLPPRGLLPIHGISQARTLEWAAIRFSRDFLTQRSKPHLLYWQTDSFTTAPPGKSITWQKESKRDQHNLWRLHPHDLLTTHSAQPPPPPPPIPSYRGSVFQHEWRGRDQQHSVHNSLYQHQTEHTISWHTLGWQIKQGYHSWHYLHHWTFLVSASPRGCHFVWLYVLTLFQLVQWKTRVDKLYISSRKRNLIYKHIL